MFKDEIEDRIKVFEQRLARSKHKPEIETLTHNIELLKELIVKGEYERKGGETKLVERDKKRVRNRRPSRKA